MLDSSAKEESETVKSTISFILVAGNGAVSRSMQRSAVRKFLGYSLWSWPVLAIRHLLAFGSSIGGTMHQCLGGEGIRGQHAGFVQSLPQ